MRPVELTWPVGEHPFLLTIDHLRALQDRCDAGPAHILTRIASGDWRIDDVVDTIRLGLEGGGMPKDDARDLVIQALDRRPIADFVLTAQSILMLSIYGPGDDPVGEDQAGEGIPTLSRVEKSDGPASTDGAPSSDCPSAPSAL